MRFGVSDAHTQSGCPKATPHPARVGFETIFSACEQSGSISAPFEAALKGSQGHGSSRHSLHCAFALYKLPRGLSLQFLAAHSEDDGMSCVKLAPCPERHGATPGVRDQHPVKTMWFITSFSLGPASPMEIMSCGSSLKHLREAAKGS